MMRCTFARLAAAAAAAAAAPSNPKMAALHKLLTGESTFRGNAPLKVCNIEHNFGADWKKEISAYAASLPAEQKKVLERQVARVTLTRYTTRELGEFCGEGPEHVDAVAREANVAQAKAYAAKNGAAKLAEYMQAEAKNAGWSDADVQKFLSEVKAAK